MRRTFIGGLLATIGVGKTVANDAVKAQPPVPLWRPSFSQPLARVADRISYYLDGKSDFAVFRNGTCAILEAGLSDIDAEVAARDILSNIFRYHPDMSPVPMDDGNILVRYNHPALNVVLADLARANWQEIESRHLDGLAASEVLMTPLGPNKFDSFGMQALLGRAYMFMDAQAPEVFDIRRHA